MSAERSAPTSGRSAWGSLARRVDPYLDPAIGVVGAGLALATLLMTDVETIDPRLREADVLSVVATVVAVGALAWRRRRPVASYAVFVLGALAVSATFHYIGLLSVLVLLSLYSLVAHRGHRVGLIGLGVGVASYLGLALAGVPDLRAKDLLMGIAFLVAAWAVGDAVRSRRELQRDALRAAVTEERLRIARELHDVVAHSMSLIAVQAGVGAHVISTDPAAAGQALDVIADTSRRALEQTRSMLGMLREETEDGTRPPIAGLGDLPALVHDVRAAGVDVELVGSAAASDVDPAVSLTVYRIVQESLTNVVKHSAAPTARVTVEATDTGLEIAVTDPGPKRTPVKAGTSGHGLVGLDERVRLVGGSVIYGAQGEGFSVRATLPIGTHR